MKRRGRFWKPKWIAHVRAWGVGIRHPEPFAKRDRKRQSERHFVIKVKREGCEA